MHSIEKAFGVAWIAAGLGDGVTPCVYSGVRSRGVGKWDVAGMLGHSDTRMVEKHYGHHDPEYLRAAAEAVSDNVPSDFHRRHTPMHAACARHGQSMVGATGIEPVTPTMST